MADPDRLRGPQPAEAAEPAAPRSLRLPRRRVLLAVVGFLFALATFAYFLPRIADYRDVWDVLRGLSWRWLLALAAAAILNLLTFAPPWMVALPGLGFRRALMLTQASTALSIIVPAGAAVGIAGAYAMLRRWGYAGREIGRAVTVASLWNQFANLSYPIIAVFALTASGGDSPVLATAAFVGVAILGIAIAALAAVLASDRTATDVGDLTARFVSWALGKFGRRPVLWGGPSFGRFRRDSLELLRRRWHLLTIATYGGTLTIFLVLLVALRACDVPGSEVSVAEAFAAWALARILGSFPITPGGIGVVELGVTGALIGFGGDNAGVVAAVLVYRFLTMVPTVGLGLLAAATFRRS
ncbi:MAG TPA: lysylphosphatidylglycerol synthase domain-containing protein [Gaiellaceae bacterium]|nr:lysylphosphatidylglycerol synthase domain-containing protein [Gaiellaceae bacterium]